jgi:hypothetical protein
MADSFYINKVSEDSNLGDLTISYASPDLGEGSYLITIKGGHKSMLNLDLANMPPLDDVVKQRLFMILYPHLVKDISEMMYGKKSYSPHDVAMACIRRIVNESSSISE